MGPDDSTTFKMPSYHVNKLSAGSSCLLLCVCTTAKPKKPIKILAITNISNNYGFNNTMLHGPREDYNYQMDKSNRSANRAVG